MLTRNLKTITELTNTIINEKYHDVMVKGISTDTRTIQKDNMFIALRGDNFDGQNYIEMAFEKGASCCVVNRDYRNINDYPVIEVDDTKEFMMDLARGYINSLNCKVIAITGSNGKTTTKDIMSSLLKEKYKVVKTQKNYNNEIGLSKTIFDIDDDTEVAVLEMGTENFGEISQLTNIAHPDIAMITNIGDSHLLNLKTKENIARAKFEILEGLKEDGIFILNNDDPVLREVKQEYKLPEKTISFGIKPDSDYRMEMIKADETGSTFSINDHVFNIELLGHHQMYNATMSIIVAELMGLDYSDVAKGLKNIELTGMRNELILLDKFHILNDSYKSNPQSLTSCLETAYGLHGYSRKIAVLGDMLELGDNEITLHKNIGKSINPEKIDYVLATGPLAENIIKGARTNFAEDKVFYFETKEELLEKLHELIVDNTLVLVKASHAMQFDKLVEQIKEI
ncbi:UDP-N-acetylmuramoyl-tripeptide--D-alanyl-D-alanine ligase [Finegoldia magna]|uniref:UDP-N-acetylmuramoyl-tripeptide--D-alanyl-D- alanine ligase n=1 Tax=Finegoldia magna TaxID=1260 RepID=UPI003F816729